MTANGHRAARVLYVVVLLALAKPLGAYMARVYEGQPIGLDRALGWLERLDLPGSRASSPTHEMGWKTYALGDAALQPRRASCAVYVLQRLQGVLPLNPAGLRRRLARFVVQHRGELRAPTPTGRATAARRR